MRGLQSAVNLVLTALQTYVSRVPTLSRQIKKLRTTRASMSALVSLLQDQKSVIERVRQDTVSVCENRSLQSGLTADANGQGSSENYSIFDSDIGDEIFSFDDEVVNSFAYRNALKRLLSKSKATQQNAKLDEHYILDEPLIDLEGLSEIHNEPRIKSTVTSNHPCLIPSKPFTHTAHLSDTVMEDLKSLLPNSVASPSPQRNERHTDPAFPLCDIGSATNTSANQSNKNRDVGKGMRHRGRAYVYHERHVLDKPAFVAPSRHSRSTNITADTVEDFSKNATLRMVRRRDNFGGGYRDTDSSTLSEKESSSSQSEEKPRVFSVNEKINTYHSNVARAGLGPTQAEAEAPRDHATVRPRRRIGRALGAIPSSPSTFRPKSPDDEIHQDQYGYESRTKASEDEGILCGRLGEHDYTNTEIDEYDKMSKEAVTDIETQPARETKRGHRWEDSTADGLTVTPLTAAALEQHEREYSSSGNVTRHGLFRQKSHRRRVLDKSQNSGHDASLIDDSESKSGDGVALKSSINAKDELYGSVENAIRQLKRLRQEQRKKRGSRKPEPSHRGSRASPVTSADISYKSPKHASDADISENSKPSRDVNNPNICEDAERPTSYFVSEDGRTVTILTKKHRSSRDKGREGALTHSSQSSQKSLLIEYFEGEKGPNVYSRPSVRVNVTPLAAREIKDTNKHVQVTESKNNRKPSYTRRIPLDPHSSGDRRATDSVDEKMTSSYPSVEKYSSLAHR